MNPILFWTNVTITLLSFHSVITPVSTHVFAMLHLSMYGVRNQQDTAIDTAAYMILKRLFPKDDILDTLYATRVFDENATDNVGDCINAGMVSAGSVMRARWPLLPYVAYPGSAEPGKWHPTPPRYLKAAYPQWGNQPTWCSEEPTVDLSNPGPFPQADGDAPPWSPTDWFAYAISGPQQTASNAEASRVLTLYALTMADATIYAWRAIYKYGVIRPPLAVDPPNWPEYPSDEAVYASVSGGMLSSWLLDRHEHTNASLAAGYELGRHVVCVLDPPSSTTKWEYLRYIIPSIFGVLLLCMGVLICIVQWMQRKKKKDDRVDMRKYANLMETIKEEKL